MHYCLVAIAGKRNKKKTKQNNLITSHHMVTFIEHETDDIEAYTNDLKANM